MPEGSTNPGGVTQSNPTAAYLLGCSSPATTLVLPAAPRPDGSPETDRPLILTVRRCRPGGKALHGHAAARADLGRGGSGPRPTETAVDPATRDPVPRWVPTSMLFSPFSDGSGCGFAVNEALARWHPARRHCKYR